MAEYDFMFSQSPLTCNLEESNTSNLIFNQIQAI